MNRTVNIFAAGLALLIGTAGLAMANGQEDGAPIARGQALSQNVGAGQGLGGPAAGGQGRGNGRNAAAGTYGAGAGNGAVQAQSYRDAETATLASMPKGTLKTEEIAKLLYMWEEEKLARDVYNSLGKMYSLPVFSNIARSEQYHMDQMAALLKRYDLALPGTNTPGTFKNAELAKAYADLIKQGSQSLDQAAKVGVAIEEMDIEDLNAALALSANQDVRYILDQLLAGSKNHLAAFQRQSQR